MSYLNTQALSGIVVTSRETVDEVLARYDTTCWSATKREANTLTRRELLQLLDTCDVHIIWCVSQYLSLFFLTVATCSKRNIYYNKSGKLLRNSAQDYTLFVRRTMDEDHSSAYIDTPYYIILQQFEVIMTLIVIAYTATL